MFRVKKVSQAIIDYLSKEEVIRISKTNNVINYLQEGSIAPPELYGKGIEPLGLDRSGKVEEELIKGISRNEPFNKVSKLSSKSKTVKRRKEAERYIANKRKKKEEFSFLEISFAVPKSVSVVWALESPERRKRLFEAHVGALKSSLDEIETNAAYARRGKGGKQHEKTNGLVFGIFHHFTSRLADPQIHGHVLIKAQAARFDGTTGKIEPRYVYHWQKYFGSVYVTKLAENVRKLGYDTIATDTSFEILGIPLDLRKCMSKRSEDMIQDIAKNNLTGANARSIAAKRTRPPKRTHNIDELFNKWEKEAAKLNYGIESIKKLRKRSYGIHIGSNEILDFPDLSPNYLASKLVESKSIFKESDVYFLAARLALESGQSLSAALNGADSLLKSDELIVELESKTRYEREFTTRKILKLENELIDVAKDLKKSKFNDNLTDTHVNQSIKKYSIKLSDEQILAISNAVDSSALAIINGSAGAGKSTIMNIVRDVYETSNHRVFGATIAKAAANNLQEQAGIRSQTIAKTLLELNQGFSNMRFGDVLIIDEAGQLGLYESLQLMKHANRLGFKIILTGEDKQLDSIRHGGVMRYLNSLPDIKPARIETVRRQRKQWDKDAVMEFRDGKAKQALLRYQENNRLSIVDTPDAAIDQLVKDWEHYKLLYPQTSPLVLTRTWQNVMKLNNKLRGTLVRRGHIGSENHIINGRVGDKAITFPVSRGEKLRLTKNDNKAGHTNGDIAFVKDIYVKNGLVTTLLLKRTDGEIIRLNLSEYSDDKGQPFIVPAYAQTIYSSQGQTVDSKVFVLNDAGVDRSSAYVALSRHRDDVHLYVAKNEFSCSSIDTDEQVIEKLAEQYNHDRYNEMASERIVKGKIEPEIEFEGN
jgi:conjugative relaxase-like TrwC/TraI family protein